MRAARALDPCGEEGGGLRAIGKTAKTEMGVPRKRCEGQFAKRTKTEAGFPGGAGDKEPACQHRRHKRCRFDPWVGKIPWRRKWQPTPVVLSGESHGRRSLAGYSPWGHKESDTTEGTSRLCAHMHTHTHTH